MKKTILKIFSSILISVLMIGAIFYFCLFINPMRIYEVNGLKWIPLLTTILTIYISGRINKNTSIVWLPTLLIPLILFKPFNFIYYPFVITLLVVSTLMLVITRANQNTIYKNLSWIGVFLIFMFYLFNQPLILEKHEFGYDNNGNLENANIIWDFSSHENTKLPYHILEDKYEMDFNLGNLKGKRYFITFWATWCEPCIEEKPELDKLKIQLANNSNIKFVDVSFDTNNSKWKHYLKSTKPIGLQLISKNHRETSRTLDFIGLPMHLIVDKNGHYKKIRSLEVAKKLILQKEKTN